MFTARRYDTQTHSSLLKLTRTHIDQTLRDTQTRHLLYILRGKCNVWKSEYPGHTAYMRYTVSSLPLPVRLIEINGFQNIDILLLAY